MLSEYEAGGRHDGYCTGLVTRLQSADEFDALKQVALFCGVGLLVSLLCMTYGLDLSPGFF